MRKALEAFVVTLACSGPPCREQAATTALIDELECHPAATVEVTDRFVVCRCPRVSP